MWWHCAHLLAPRAHAAVPDSGVKHEVAHFLFKQLIAAVKYFQEKGVVHRDIKPENILLDKCVTTPRILLKRLALCCAAPK